MNRVIHFEIHAEDPSRAGEFYRAVFGWKAKEWIIPGIDMPDENRYWMLDTGEKGEPGIDGGIMVRKGPAPTGGEPVSSYVCTIGVDSVDETIKKIEEVGGIVTVSKMAVMQVGWLAYCKDTEGNIFGIMENDESAK